MDTTTLSTLAVLALLAVLAPLLAQVKFFLRVPVVVIEIVLGIVSGPQVLGLARTNPSVNFLSELGLAFLLFQAGFELNIERIKGRPFRLAVLGWVISVGLALSLAALLQAMGLVNSLLYVGIAMSTTAIGVIMPILSDSGMLQSSFGSLVLAIGAVGEFGPIILSALLLEKSGSKTVDAILLNAFLLIVLVSFYLARHWRPEFLIRAVDKTISSTAQLGIRLSLLILVGLIYVAATFGFSILLGAFGAGLIVAQAVSHLDKKDRDLLDAKYQGLGSGFVIPIFFLVSGLNFDLIALLQSGWKLLLVPLFLLLFIVVRATPIFLLAGRQVARRAQLRIGLLSAVELPVLAAITQLGVHAGQLHPATATAMVGAGMLSVLLLPIVALKLNSSNINTSSIRNSTRLETDIVVP